MRGDTKKSWVYSAICELTNAARSHQPAYLRDETLAVCRKALDQYALERAVIDAAEACYHAKDTGEALVSGKNLDIAVRALLAAKGGEDG